MKNRPALRALVLPVTTQNERRYVATVRQGHKTLYSGPLRLFEDTAQGEAEIKKLELEKSTTNP